MKLFKVGALLCLLSIFITGCSSTQSPEQLAEVPIYNENKRDLYEEIGKLLKGTSSTFILPTNSKQVGKINEVDLDNDGVKEIVVFEKREDTNSGESKVGFRVLTKKNDNTYMDNGKMLESGDSIKYANFYDLDADGYKEIILLVKVGDISNMYIYKFKDNKISNIYTLDPTWIDDKDNLLDMRIEIGYIDNDSSLDILMLHHNSKTNEMYANIANFKENLKVVDNIKINNVKNLDDLYITIGDVATSKKEVIKGAVLDIPLFKEKGYITQILYLKDNKLNKAFSDSDENMMKPYYIPVDDVDKDKIIDIPIVNRSGSGYSYTSKSSATISWYRWNGKSDSDSAPLFTIQIYYNYQYNYKILIPNILVNKLEVDQEYSGDNVLFKFYYYDIVDMEPKKLFTISVANKNIADENKNLNNQNGSILRETEDHTFLIYIDDSEELKKLDITADVLKEYFLLIYE